ncbi:MAG: DUF4302 domain-containing protein [Sphingobacterium sp.]|nr:DUF4302 domain-containing protein [Sphingobacterium sp.]
MKIYRYILLVALGLSLVACEKKEVAGFAVEEVFVGGEAKADSLTKVLTSASNGWQFKIQKSTLEPQQLLTGFYKFESNNAFDFAADYSLEYAAYTKGNNFYLSNNSNAAKLHFKSKTEDEPGATVSAYAQLLLAEDQLDADFTYKNAVKDTLVFVGEAKGNVLKLYRANADEENIYAKNIFQGYIQNYMDARDFLSTAPRFFFNVSYKGKSFFYYIEQPSGDLIFHVKNGAQWNYYRTGYDQQLHKIILKNPFTVDGETISEFADYQMGENGLTFMDGSIKNESKGIGYESAIADFQKRNTPSPYEFDTFGYYLSWYGFSNREKLDLLGLKAWRSDFTLSYLFHTADGSQGPYDRWTLSYFNNGSRYSWGGDYGFYRTVNESAGTMIFRYQGAWSWSWGSASESTQTTLTNMRSNYRTYLTRASGFYVLKTIDGQIALVSADDAEMWILFK